MGEHSISQRFLWEPAYLSKSPKILNPKSIKTFQKKVSQFCNFGKKLFGQKSPVQAAMVHTDRQNQTQEDIATYKLNWPRGRFSENLIMFFSLLQRFCCKCCRERENRRWYLKYLYDELLQLILGKEGAIEEVDI